MRAQMLEGSGAHVEALIAKGLTQCGAGGLIQRRLSEPENAGASHQPRGIGWR